MDPNLPKRATRDGFGEAMMTLGEEHGDVVALCADLTGSVKLDAFASKYPERFFNIGIAEANMVNVAAGLATTGKVPYAATFAIFMTGRPWEQIRTSVALQELNVRLAGSHGGISVGEDGASHQATEDIAIMRVIPGMSVVVPADYEAARLLTIKSYDYDGPLYIRLGRPKMPVIYGNEIELDDNTLEIGKGLMLRDGSDVAIIACGHMVTHALLAAEILEGKGVEAAVVDMHTIKPLDGNLLARMARRCGAVVTVEEHQINGGLGGAVCEYLAEHEPVPVRRMGLDNVFGQSGTPDELFEFYGLMPEDIAKTAERAIARKKVVSG